MFHNEGLHGLIKSRRLGWAGHVARMEEGRSTFKILTGKPMGISRLLSKNFKVKILPFVLYDCDA